MNFYGHVTQSFGGYGIVTGHRVGLFGAYGQAPTIVNATCPPARVLPGSGQPFTRIGIDFSLTFNKEWNLFGAIMHGHDSSRIVCIARHCHGPKRILAWSVRELDYYPAQFFDMPDWFFAYRYDVIRNERQGDSNSNAFPGNYNDVDSHTCTWCDTSFINPPGRISPSMRNITAIARRRSARMEAICGAKRCWWD